MGIGARRGRRALTERSPARVLSAYDLLAGTPADRQPADLPDSGLADLPADLLADLHAPDLVITPDYVGPGYGRPTTTVPGAHPTPAAPVAGGVSRWLRGWEVLAVVLISVGLAVPLTLVAWHPRTPAPSPVSVRTARPPAPVGAGNSP